MKVVVSVIREDGAFLLIGIGNEHIIIGMTVNERAIKIAEEEIGDEICNKIGIRATGAIIRAIERALVERTELFIDGIGPVEKTEL